MEVLTFGLEIYENELIEKALNKYDVCVRPTEVYTDFIAIPAILLIINANSIDKEVLNDILSFYYEIEKFNEIIILIGDVQVRKEFKSSIFKYKSFGEFKDKLEYHVLSALRTEKKTHQFSRTLANSIKILQLIKRNEGISTKKLAEELELSPRTIQRYIETLRVAGEWIEYDKSANCWYLIEGKSILLDDI